VGVSHFPDDLLLVIDILEIPHSIFQRRLFFEKQLLSEYIPLVVVFWIAIVAQGSRTNIPELSICQGDVTRASKRNKPYILRIFYEDCCLHNVYHVVSILILKICIKS
jgi:hypothetical protein